MICRENYGSQPITRRYIRTTAGTLVAVDDSQRLTSVSQFFRVRSYFQCVRVTIYMDAPHSLLYYPQVSDIRTYT